MHQPPLNTNSLQIPQKSGRVELP
jgi:hypothetical protein